MRMPDRPARGEAAPPLSSGPSAVLVSVIIPAHNDAVHLERVLPLLNNGLREIGPAEIVVVANGCTDDTVARCRAHGVVCLERPTLTPGAARNEGVRIARGRWLAFLDADVAPSPAWFATVAGLARPDSRVADRIVGWPVLAPEESGWVARAWQEVRFSAERTPSTLDCGNLLVTRAFFDELGGFDAGRVAGEDVDFCERAVAAGVTLGFDSRLAVHHYGEPRGLREFFRRELFHADPITLVVRNSPYAALDATLVIVLLAWTGSLAGLLWALVRPGWIPLAFVLLGPAALALGGVSKAAVRWRTSGSWRRFAQMAFLCQLMILARLIGLFVRPRTWRAGHAI